MDEEPEGQYELVGPSVAKPPPPPPPARLPSKSTITPAYSTTNFIAAADEKTFVLASPIWLKVQLFAAILMFVISVILTVLVVIANNTPTHKKH
ncbi:unnamed protein product [Caenorhabditis angaria]|uniref:Uncharacterized protein n=1 Tax=Caenorhabditis angaria TaxID=860376 RepID=A0A9P1IJK5_9PELO|nr:unnamed protein product [Caenorhabditis angaria]